MKMNLLPDEIDLLPQEKWSVSEKTFSEQGECRWRNSHEKNNEYNNKCSFVWYVLYKEYTRVSHMRKGIAGKQFIVRDICLCDDQEKQSLKDRKWKERMNLRKKLEIWHKLIHLNPNPTFIEYWLQKESLTL